MWSKFFISRFFSWLLIEKYFDFPFVQGKVEARNGRNSVWPYLIARDVAAEGLDWDDMKHLITYDYPNSSEKYVQRIGRSIQNWTTGFAFTFLSENHVGQAEKSISILNT